MQKQTFKLQNQLALVFALATLALPNQAQASWGFFLGGGAKVAFPFLMKKAKITGLTLPKFDGTKPVGPFAEVGEIETEPTDWFKTLGLELGFSGIYKMNDMFGIGGTLNLGFSFNRDQQKSWKSLTISEGFFAKVGVSVMISDWVMLTAGVRASCITLEINYTDDEKKGIDLYNGANGLDGVNAGTVVGAPGDVADPAGTALSPAWGLSNAHDKTKFFANATANASDDAYRLDKSGYSDGQWAWSWFGDASVFIGLTDSLKLYVKAGIFGDFNAPEFKEYKNKKGALKYVAAVTANPNATPPVAGVAQNLSYADEKDNSMKPKFDGRLGLEVVVGLAFCI